MEEAHQVLRRERNKDWSRELLIMIGSTLFGAFIPGFISELSAGRQLLIAIYTFMGFVGIILVFVGLRR